MKKRYSLMLFLMLMTSSGISQAQCFQPSPNLLAMGDRYYHQLQPHQWSSKDEKIKDALLDAAEDDWKGDYSESECFGSDKNPREVQRSASVKAEITKVMKGTLKLSAWKKFAAEGKTESDVVQLFDERHVFTGDVSKTSLRTAEVHAARLAGGGRRMDEILSTLEINGDQLTLTRKIYYNGYLGRVERYSLQRD